MDLTLSSLMSLAPTLRNPEVRQIEINVLTGKADYKTWLGCVNTVGLPHVSLKSKPQKVPA